MGLGFINWTKTAAATVAMTAVLAVACGGNSDSAKSTSLVPEGSTLMGDIDFQAILTDLDLELLFDSLPVGDGGLASFVDFFAGAQVESGIEFRDVTNVEFFGDAARSTDYFGVAVYGEFDESAVIAEISDQGDSPLLPDSYKGYDIYTPQNDPDQFTLSVLDAGTLALGTDRALKDMIDVRAGDRAATSGLLADSLNDLGDRLFGLVVLMPGVLSNESVGPDSLLGGGSSLLGDLPISLDFLDSIETLGLAGSIRGENVGLTAVLDFEDEEAAKSTTQFLGGLISLVSSLSTDPETQELVAGLEVDQSGDRLTLGIELPEALLAKLLGDLTTITDSTTIPGVTSTTN